MNRSSTVGMPSSRSPPPGFGIATRYRLRLIAIGEQVLAQPRPVHTQMIGQLFDRHPVDAGTSRILPNTLQCGLKVPAFTYLLHQVAASQALVSIASQGASTRAAGSCGFTAAVDWAPGSSSGFCGTI